MSEIILLRENWFSSDDVTQQIKLGKPLLEAKINNTTKGKDLYIEGVFLQANVVNKNKRLYPKKVLEEAIEKYMNEQVRSHQQLGEFNHPDRPYVDPKNACLVIEDMWWEGDNVMGRAKIAVNDGADGTKLAGLIEAGWIPGVSSRGLGSLKEKAGYNEVNPGYILTVGVDVVWGPSAPDAFVKPVFESENLLNKEDTSEVNENKQLTEQSFNKLIDNLKKLYK